MEGRGSTRRRAIAVVAAGLVVAMAFAAGSASGAAKLLTVKKAKKLFYLESEAEARFLDASEASAAFVEDVKVVVVTVPVSDGTFSGTQADCPAGYEAVGGGVAGSSNLPIVQTQPDLGADYPAAGTYESAPGWRGYFGPANGSQTGIVLAVCAK